MQQWVGLINEIMNVNSWMVLKSNHCYQRNRWWKVWCGIRTVTRKSSIGGFTFVQWRLTFVKSGGDWSFVSEGVSPSNLPPCSYGTVWQNFNLLSTDSASLVVSSQKKIFQFRVRGSLGGASQVVVFSRFYGLLFPALDANRMGPHFRSKIFLKLGYLTSL